ncbi:LuxR C-terminal-related transcriptional regulator [Solirubrobacter ginsenosidimutans]|uniref:LuxR C-terminal-related transcriptional regulator n=1 Tax=Solirubrobacter ginsenosidimutans TaxID=490573 RepID=A0A9X3RZ85_9ACTN|nr:helix-turn-helix transcriptional regulator [Solirubrobacter ginsenosidimutans]MDA0159899.1 LuxR C-terminal-related transcriptional regulator [Solirubrobacter ginsenosidimutans]
MLRGRRRECAVLDGLLANARAGRSGTLVLLGDAGVGKTALLEYAIDAAFDLRTLRAVGVESERELAFAALQQFCAPLIHWLDRLPTPQRDALAIAFGLRRGPVPDRFIVGLAVLSLLSEAAQERPLLCVIDDAQWLDRASADVLAFVARRVLAESVVMLFAAREPSDRFAGLAQLTIGGLPDPDARALLASVIPGRLDERVVDRLLAETHGNPLALLELPRGLTAAQLAGGFAIPRPLSLQGRIEQSFLQRLKALPPNTQRLLLTAAAEPLGDPALLWRAAERLQIAGLGLEPAVSAGLLEVGQRVRFRHPLVRSVVYRTATPPERRRVHRALAEATDAQVDPDRRAWHLAEAAERPDEAVATELVRAADRAQARGGLAAAAAFLERAAALTPEADRRARRSLAAAQTKYEAGALDDTRALLATAEVGPLDDLHRARVHLLRAQVAFAARRGSDAPPLLLRAARELEAVDTALARSTYLEALSAAMFAGRLARGGGTAEVSAAALAGPPPPQPPRPSDLLLQGLAVRFTDGYAAGAPILKEALRAFARETILPPQEARWLWFASQIALDLWDDHTWTLLSTRQLDLVRETGALTALPFVLTTRISVFTSFGELGAAVAYEEELRAVTETTGIAPGPYGALSLAGLRGREAEFIQLIGTTVKQAEARGEGLALTVTERLSGALYNGLGRYDSTLTALCQVERYAEEGPALWALGELVEAAVRTGQPQLAHGPLARIAETAHASGTDWGLGIEARCRALLAEGDEADGLYREAIRRFGSTRIRVQLARSHLLYGEWLRSERRRLEAREQLRIAFEMLNAMGIEAFAARAERELLATGVRARKRAVETHDDLTAQETQIARMASEGLSNAEIGSRLFISQHTVAYHLRKVFVKLGVSSRSQLLRALPQGA